MTDLVQSLRKLGAMQSKQDLISAIEREEQKQSRSGEGVKQEVEQNFVYHGQIASSRARLTELTQLIKFQITEVNQLDAVKQSFDGFYTHFQQYQKDVTQQKLEKEHHDLIMSIKEISSLVQAPSANEEQIKFISQLITKATLIYQRTPDKIPQKVNLHDLILSARCTMLAHLGYLQEDWKTYVDDQFNVKPYQLKNQQKISDDHFIPYEAADEKIVFSEIVLATLQFRYWKQIFVNTLSTMQKLTNLKNQMFEERQFTNYKDFLIHFSQQKSKQHNHITQLTNFDRKFLSENASDILFIESVLPKSLAQDFKQGGENLLCSIEFILKCFNKLQPAITAMQLEQRLKTDVMFKNCFDELFTTLKDLFFDGDNVLLPSILHIQIATILKQHQTDTSFTLYEQLQKEYNQLVIDVQSAVLYQLCTMFRNIARQVICQIFLNDGCFGNYQMTELFTTTCGTFCQVIQNLNITDAAMVRYAALELLQGFQTLVDQAYTDLESTATPMEVIIQLVNMYEHVFNIVLPKLLKEYHKTFSIELEAKSNFHQAAQFDSSPLQLQKLAGLLRINQEKSAQALTKHVVVGEHKAEYDLLMKCAQQLHKALVRRLTGSVTRQVVQYIGEIHRQVVDSPQLVIQQNIITSAQFADVIGQFINHQLNPAASAKLQHAVQAGGVTRILAFLQIVRLNVMQRLDPLTRELCWSQLQKHTVVEAKIATSCAVVNELQGCCLVASLGFVVHCLGGQWKDVAAEVVLTDEGAGTGANSRTVVGDFEGLFTALREGVECYLEGQQSAVGDGPEIELV